MRETVTAFLSKEVSDLDHSGIVSQRLKRLESIEIKLRHSHTRLTQMQDIGGCRAILQNVDKVRRLAEAMQRPDLFRGEFKYLVSVHSDYVLKPKTDGYRGVHLITEYNGESA